MYLMTEKLTSTVAMYMILKRILRPWNEWTAYKNGIIDANGKRLRKPKTSREREGWDILDRFCWSIKRVCTKYIGDSQFAYLFSAAYLMKEQCNIILKENQDKYKLELSNFTLKEQQAFYKCFVELNENNFLVKNNLDLETNILKNLNSVKLIIDKYLKEDETTVADIAQFTPKININKVQQRIKFRRRKLNVKRKL